MKVISDYDYLYKVVDYDYNYIPSWNADCDYYYLRSCKRLQSITITDYDYLNPSVKSNSIYLVAF